MRRAEAIGFDYERCRPITGEGLTRLMRSYVIELYAGDRGCGHVAGRTLAQRLGVARGEWLTTVLRGDGAFEVYVSSKARFVVRGSDGWIMRMPEPGHSIRVTRFRQQDIGRHAIEVRLEMNLSFQAIRKPKNAEYPSVKDPSLSERVTIMIPPGEHIALSKDSQQELVQVPLYPGDEATFRAAKPDDRERLGALDDDDAVMVVRRHQDATEEYAARLCELVAAVRAG